MTELGNILKEAREAKGLSLDELQSITKIQKRYLLGIEEGNYSMMPGKFYVRAFIKQYAEAVGLDPEQLFEQHKNEIPSTYNEELPEQLSRVQSRRSLSPDTSKVLDFLPKLLIALFMIGAIALIWYLIVKSAGDDAEQPANTDKSKTNIEEPQNFADDSGDEGAGEEEDPPEEEEPAEEEAEPETPAQELTVASNSGSNTVYELKNTDKFVVKVVSLGRTWVSVKNGTGKIYFGEELNKDAKVSQTADLTNDTQALIKVGFAPDTEIYVNDQKLEYAISPADATTQNITINFVK
ncbi:helix-turn-helix domain-containing protein [Mesobacillus boroniphilus]|uniref:Transcriptional regulator in cluster with unspecified monosaccharide ABC transport system n=1 Tax=Mesobacillus boroniphilus JCM 21738 TaxID=1294265 RepID=W4RIL5_9BACI|nr:helix-turn-helix domain-containing protein [Mesobacillus boroniphilus]GAE43743.1 transcriptional regulator in cluster with unspecified monosaccharide ABC transport system [Mesobacillus boroniphilus JCM 21738]